MAKESNRKRKAQKEKLQSNRSINYILTFFFHLRGRRSTIFIPASSTRDRISVSHSNGFTLWSLQQPIKEYIIAAISADS